MRNSESAAFIKRWIHRRSGQVCRRRRELKDDVRFEPRTIKSSKSKVGIVRRGQDGEPITRIGDEGCACWKAIDRRSSDWIVRRLEEDALRAILQGLNRVRERLKTDRLTNRVTWQEEAIKAQPNARRRLHEVGHRSIGILRCQRDGRGVSASIRAEKCGVDEMQGRGVEGLVFRRSDVTSGEKNSSEEGKKKDEVRRSR